RDGEPVADGRHGAEGRRIADGVEERAGAEADPSAALLAEREAALGHPLERRERRVVGGALAEAERAEDLRAEPERAVAEREEAADRVAPLVLDAEVVDLAAAPELRPGVEHEEDLLEVDLRGREDRAAGRAVAGVGFGIARRDPHAALEAELERALVVA